MHIHIYLDTEPIAMTFSCCHAVDKLQVVLGQKKNMRSTEKMLAVWAVGYLKVKLGRRFQGHKCL